MHSLRAARDGQADAGSACDSRPASSAYVHRDILEDPPLGEGWDEHGNDLSKIANEVGRSWMPSCDCVGLCPASCCRSASPWWRGHGGAGAACEGGPAAFRWWNEHSRFYSNDECAADWCPLVRVSDRVVSISLEADT